jgi:hypothetical protein
LSEGELEDGMRSFRFLAIVVVAALAASGLFAGPLGIELRFDRLNGSYEDLVAEVEPIRSGPLTVRLTSPQHRLELKSNRLNLSPLDGESHAVSGRVRFSGSGSLFAELDFGGLPASLEDEVVFPDQETVVEGKIRIDIVDEGYLVTVETLPKFVEIEMQSKLGSGLVAWCSRLALLVAGDAGCDELEQELSHPRLPLPAQGVTHLVRAEELTSEERAEIDLYLASY